MRPVQDKGPVRMLCEEIDFAFDQRLESPAVFVAFVRELVDEIAEQREMHQRISALTGAPPSEGSAEVVALAYAMLSGADAGRSSRAEAVHDAADRLNPEDGYPTDHTIDMLNSCASAIRFGLEAPCRSRHAADAAKHVFRQIYGVSRHDQNTPRWANDWVRTKLLSAIIGLVPASAPATASQSPPESDSSREAIRPASPPPLTGEGGE